MHAEGGSAVPKAVEVTEAAEGPVRLQKFMAACGVASRRRCEELIAEGRVRVNGALVTEPGTRVTPGSDRVTLDGAPVEPRSSGLVYYMFHKPRGCVVTARDPQGRPTIYDFLDSIPERVVPVGRLDLDSEGLLILTNDGELTHRLMHPRYGVEKEYHVLTEEPVDEEAVRALREGVEIEGGRTGPARVRVLSENRKRLSLTITEGRKRQVRQMIAAVGGHVVRLRRVREGRLKLGSLPPGQVRPLSRREVQQLRREVGLAGKGEVD